LFGRQVWCKQVPDEDPAKQRHRKRLDQPIDEKRDTDAAHVITHLAQARKSIRNSIGMIINQINSPTGRLTRDTSIVPMA